MLLSYMPIYTPFLAYSLQFFMVWYVDYTANVIHLFSNFVNNGLGEQITVPELTRLRDQVQTVKVIVRWKRDPKEIPIPMEKKKKAKLMAKYPAIKSSEHFETLVFFIFNSNGSNIPLSS